MDNVNKTLYIPLYGKAYVSKKGIILSDKTAEEIWSKEGFALNGKAKSKWLAYYMGMRSATIDSWVKGQISNSNDCIILHLGCGLDSRVIRIGDCPFIWFDIDFESVIKEREKYFNQTEKYQMLCQDVKNGDFVAQLPNAKKAIVIMEGVSMYLQEEELKNCLIKITSKFEEVAYMVDCYTPFAAKMSKLKNPIKSVGVSQVYGIKDEFVLEEGTDLKFVKEHEITPQYLIEELSGFEKTLFKRLYAGKTSKKLYKLYEYRKQKD